MLVQRYFVLYTLYLPHKSYQIRLANFVGISGNPGYVRNLFSDTTHLHMTSLPHLMYVVIWGDAQDLGGYSWSSSLAAGSQLSKIQARQLQAAVLISNCLGKRVD